MKSSLALKTSRSARISSLPKIQRNPYLELFMLQNEKEKLLRESEVTRTRLEDALGRIREIDEEIEKLQGRGTGVRKKRITRPKGLTSSSSGGQEKSDWQTMKLGY